jgi:hypothetical protein
MDRRAFLAGAGAVGLGAVSVSAGYVILTDDDSDPYALRVVRGKRSWSEVRCVLDPEVVRGHPALEATLADAEDESIGEAVRRGMGAERAREIRDALAECDPETSGNGLYRWQGEWYLIGILIVDPDRVAGHHDGHDHEHNASHVRRSAVQ